MLKPINLLRYGLPGAFCVLGVVLLCLGGTLMAAAGGTSFTIAAVVFGVNIFARMTMSSQSDRDREELARQFYSANGRWPDQPKPVVKPGLKPAPRAGAVDIKKRYDPGHRTGAGAAGSRRGLSSQRRRGRRPD